MSAVKGMSSYQARQFLLCVSFWCDGILCQLILELKSIVLVVCFLILFTSERSILNHHMMINPGNGSAIFLHISLSVDGYLFFR